MPGLNALDDRTQREGAGLRPAVNSKRNWFIEIGELEIHRVASSGRVGCNGSVSSPHYRRRRPYSGPVIPLVCLDVDGTLVGPTGTVTDAVWRAAEAASARGQHLAVTTARGAFASAWDMATRLDPDGWHVFHAGAAIVHTGTGAVRSVDFHDEQVEAAAHLAARNGWVVEYYSATDYTVDDDHPLAVDHAALIGVPFERRDRSSLDEPVVRVQLVVPESDLDAVAEATPAGLHTSSATSPVMPGAAFVTMTRNDVDKGTGIAAIATELDLDLGDVMMVGVSHNDRAALEIVGHPVAMGNADDEIKAMAHHVVASVHDDGVVEALILSGQLGDN